MQTCADDKTIMQFGNLQSFWCETPFKNVPRERKNLNTFIVVYISQQVFCSGNANTPALNEKCCFRQGQ